MRHRTDRWVKLAARGRFQMEAKARIGEKDYVQISAPKIERNLMSAPLTVGGCSTGTLSLSILTDDEIKSTSPVVIMGRLTDGKIYSEWLEFGTFYINQRDTSFEGLVMIDCFDSMLKTNQNYLDGSDTSANWPKSMKAVVEEIAYRIGVGVDPRTKINTGSDYVVPYPSGKTMQQVLGDIGACHGGNWIITEENLLRLVPLVSAPDETFHVISHDYEKVKTNDGHLLIYDEQKIINRVLPEASGETPESVVPITHYIKDEYGNIIVTPEGHYLVWSADGSADAVDGIINIPVVCGQITTGTKITITGVTLNSDSGESYTAGDDSGMILTIESNPYATQGICDDLYNAFNGLVYFPYTATKALYDPATELGDQVKIGDMVHSVLFTSKLDFDLNFRSDISAPNSESLSEEYPYLSEIAKLKQTTEQLNGAIESASKELSGKVDDAALQAEIDRATGVEKALNESIGAEEKRAKEAEGVLDGRIKSIEESSNSTEALAKRVTDVEAEIDGLQESLGSYNETSGTHGKAIKDLTDKVTANTEKLSGLETTSGQHTEQIAALQPLVEKVSALETTVAAQAETLTSVQERIGSIETDLVSIYSRLTALETTTGQHTTSLFEHGEAITALNTFKEQQDTYNTDTQGKLSSIEASITDILSRLTALENPGTGGTDTE